MADSYTSNFNLILPEFDKPRYHTDVNNNFSTIDALLALYVTTLNVRGVWENSTSYASGDHAVDPDDGGLYKALSANTSTAAPATFAEYRAAYPGVWTSATLGVRARGQWLASTDYALGDYVVNGSVYAICTEAHTSSSSFAADSAKWVYLIDFDASDIVQQVVLDGGTDTISLANGSHAVASVTASGTLALSFPTKQNRTQAIRVTFVFTGAYTITPPACRWPNGAAPTISQAVGGNRQEFLFTTSDSGLTIDAFVLGMNMS